MLETEEVDDDFFTPVAGTSLATIFGNTSKNVEEPVNDTLKYVPPKPQSIPTKPKPEQVKSKTTECVFACTLFGHEWSNNVYAARGTLGFAIIKITKTGDHNIILYDSNKTTLSSTTISENVSITIRNLAYISYYDNHKKYWSMYGTEEKITKVAEHLGNLGVSINYSANVNQGPPTPINVDMKTNNNSELSKATDKESDTDSSVNRKTKASILNRMANMGHSVLPTRAQHAEVTSDSSDTMDTEIQPKSVRHKPMKSVTKKANMESTTPQSQLSSDVSELVILPKIEPIEKVSVYTSHSQLLPVTNSSIFTSPSNEFGMFISEQRISNSELRINMNRISDKVDSVLNKMSNVEQKGDTNVQNAILMKLLTEYENKIKVYEELLKARHDKPSIENILTTSAISNNDKEIDILNNKISELENVNQAKCKEISNLQIEIQLLQNKFDNERLAQSKEKDELREKISSLNNIINAKDVEIADLTKKCQIIPEDTKSMNDQNIGDKVKNIMNDTFQTISVNFDDTESYSGESVKKIVAAVIKKITIQTLNDLK